MFSTGIDQLLGFCFPYFDRFVASSRGNVETIGRPCHRAHFFEMSTEGDVCVARFCLPYLYRPIVARRSNIFAIRRPCQRINMLAMSLVGEDILAVAGSP